MDKVGIMTSAVLLAVLLGAIALGDSHAPAQGPPVKAQQQPVPATGAKAPDLTLAELGGDDTVSLSSITAQQPVVLVFGCRASRSLLDNSAQLEQLYLKHRSEARFYLVCINAMPRRKTEPQPAGRRSENAVQPPADAQTRKAGAERFAAESGLTMPVLIDGPDDIAARAFGAHPERIVVINAGGRISYAGNPGPPGLNMDELSSALTRMQTNR